MSVSDCSTEYIVKNMIKESGLKDVKVVATGGLGKIIANETKYIQYYNLSEYQSCLHTADGFSCKNGRRFLNLDFRKLRRIFPECLCRQD